MAAETIYFDNSATTAPCEPAVSKALDVMRRCYGNPSSLHIMGTDAYTEIDEARRAVAGRLSADKSRLIFTSGGTEANNLAVIGTARAMRRRGKRIVTTSVEHASVARAVDFLEEQGFEVIRVKPDHEGRITAEDIAAAVNSETILVSVMMVNNETGLILPVEKIKPMLENTPAKLHIDAVQAFGKLPVDVRALGADMLTVSAHKIHGIKGAGALYISKSARVLPNQLGGEQEGGIRPGTEAVPAIAAFGAAAEALPDMQEEYKKISAVRDRLRSRLIELGAVINSPNDAMPYILNFSCIGIRSEVMLHYLSGRGMFVSSGSACSKGKKSRVLAELGFDDARIDSALRVSFSRFNTLHEADAFADAVADGMSTLKHTSVRRR